MFIKRIFFFLHSVKYNFSMEKTNINRNSDYEGESRERRGEINFHEYVITVTPIISHCIITIKFHATVWCSKSSVQTGEQGRRDYQKSVSCTGAFLCKSSREPVSEEYCMLELYFSSLLNLYLKDHENPFTKHHSLLFFLNPPISHQDGHGAFLVSMSAEQPSPRGAKVPVTKKYLVSYTA